MRQQTTALALLVAALVGCSSPSGVGMSNEPLVEVVEPNPGSAAQLTVRVSNRSGHPIAVSTCPGAGLRAERRSGDGWEEAALFRSGIACAASIFELPPFGGPHVVSVPLLADVVGGEYRVRVEVVTREGSRTGISNVFNLD